MANNDQASKFAGCFCGGAVICVLGLAILGWIFEAAGCTGGKRSVSGSTGTVEIKVMWGSSADVAGYQAAEDVYRLASKNPHITKVVVKCQMGVADGTVVDKYGNKVRGPLDMGEFEVTDLDEVRRYADVSAYAYRQQHFFTAQIARLENGEYLK